MGSSSFFSRNIFLLPCMACCRGNRPENGLAFPALPGESTPADMRMTTTRLCGGLRYFLPLPPPQNKKKQKICHQSQQPPGAAILDENPIKAAPPLDITSSSCNFHAVFSCSVPLCVCEGAALSCRAGKNKIKNKKSTLMMFSRAAPCTFSTSVCQIYARPVTVLLQQRTLCRFACMHVHSCMRVSHMTPFCVHAFYPVIFYFLFLTLTQLQMSWVSLLRCNLSG